MNFRARKIFAVSIYISLIFHLCAVCLQYSIGNLEVLSIHNILYVGVCLVSIGINCYPEIKTKAYFDLTLKLLLGLLASFGLLLPVPYLALGIYGLVFYLLITVLSFNNVNIALK